MERGAELGPRGGQAGKGVHLSAPGWGEAGKAEHRLLKLLRHQTEAGGTERPGGKEALASLCWGSAYLRRVLKMCCSSWLLRGLKEELCPSGLCQHKCVGGCAEPVGAVVLPD